MGNKENNKFMTFKWAEEYLGINYIGIKKYI